MNRPQRILIVSDEAVSGSVRDALEQGGFEVTLAPDFQTAYGELLKSSFMLVIVALADGIDGVELIRCVRATPKLTGILILFVTEWGAGTATVALPEGADAYEPRPLETNRVLASVERLLSRQAVVIK